MTAQSAAVAEKKEDNGRERWVVYGVVGGFLLHGGSAIVNLFAGFWLIKYLWAWKLMSFMPSIGSGPTAEGGSTKWVTYLVLAIVFANVANLSFADFRNRPAAFIHMGTNGWMLAVACVAMLDYYIRKSTALSGLTDVQLHVMHSMFATALATTVTGLVALRLNRLYFGDLAGGGHAR